jgi:hypothetical protein
VLGGERLAPRDQRAVILPDRRVQLREEVLLAFRQIEIVAIGLQFREPDRDDGLAGAEVLIELDRVGRLRDRVDLERNQTDIEVIEVLRHRLVWLLPEKPHVGQRLQR